MNNPFVNKSKASDSQEVSRLSREVYVEMIEERNFWDNCVQWAMNEDDTADANVRRCVDIADRLLEIRRSRFPKVR